MPIIRNLLQDAFGASAAHELEKFDLTQQQLFEGLLASMKALKTAKPSQAEILGSGFWKAFLPRGMNSDMSAIMGADAEDFRELDTRAPEDDAGREDRIARIKADLAEVEDRGRQKEIDEKDAQLNQEARALDKETQQRKEAEEARQAEIRAAQDAATIEEFVIKLKEDQLELEKARAEIAGDKARGAALDDELSILREGYRLHEATGQSIERVSQLLRDRNALQRQAKELQEEHAKRPADKEKAAGQAKFGAEAAEQTEIDRLRSRGRNRAADKMEKARDLRSRTKEFMEQGGLSEKEATAKATTEQNIQEDSEYFDRTGKRKIRGATNAREFTGLDGAAKSSTPMGMKDEWNFPALDAAKADRKNRPLKSERDAAAAAAGSARSGGPMAPMVNTLEKVLSELQAIRAATEQNRPPVAQRLRPV